MKVYEARYNEMTEESSFATLSIHLSKEGAEKAIEQSKAEEKAEFESFYKDHDAPFPWDTFKAWHIAETEVLP